MEIIVIIIETNFYVFFFFSKFIMASAFKLISNYTNCIG